MATNPNHAVNESERMRDYSLRVTARKQRNWAGFDRIQAASFERRVQGAEVVHIRDGDRVEALPERTFLC